MNKFVLVIKKGNSFKIGKNEYTKENAETRLEELKSAGINNMTIMSFNEAYGIN